MNFNSQRFKLDLPMTQKIEPKKSKQESKENQEKNPLLSGVANFVIGLIVKCGHELIPLDPPRSRTKQDRTWRFPQALIIEFTTKQKTRDIPLSVASYVFVVPISLPCSCDTDPTVRHKPTKVKVEGVYSMKTYAYDQGIMQ